MKLYQDDPTPNSATIHGKRYRFRGEVKGIHTADGLRIGDGDDPTTDLDVVSENSDTELRLASGTGGATAFVVRANDTDDSLEVDGNNSPAVRLHKNAPADTVWVASGGEIGLGTSTTSQGRLTVFDDNAGGDVCAAVHNRDTAQTSGSKATVDLAVGGFGKIQGSVQAAKTNPVSGANGRLELYARISDSLSRLMYFDGTDGATLDTVLTFTERTAEPSNPAEGKGVVWMTNGTGFGDDGDLCYKSTVGGTTRKIVIGDHSAGST